MAGLADGRVTVHTTAATAPAVLTRAGGQVTAHGPDRLTVTGLPAEAIVSVLSANAVAFSEVATRRATLEQAYFELTRDAVEFRPTSGRSA